jgi:hypothetical protein
MQTHKDLCGTPEKCPRALEGFTMETSHHHSIFLCTKTTSCCKGMKVPLVDPSAWTSAMSLMGWPRHIWGKHQGRSVCGQPCSGTVLRIQGAYRSHRCFCTALLATRVRLNTSMRKLIFPFYFIGKWDISVMRPKLLCYSQFSFKSKSCYHTASAKWLAL